MQHQHVVNVNLEGLLPHTYITLDNKNQLKPRRNQKNTKKNSAVLMQHWYSTITVLMPYSGLWHVQPSVSGVFLHVTQSIKCTKTRKTSKKPKKTKQKTKTTKIDLWGGGHGSFVFCFFCFFLFFLVSSSFLLVFVPFMLSVTCRREEHLRLRVAHIADLKVVWVLY